MQLSQGYPLKRLFMSLVADHDLIELLRLDVKMLSNLMTKIEDCYDPNVPCTYCCVHTLDGHATAPEMHGRIKSHVGLLPHSSQQPARCRRAADIQRPPMHVVATGPHDAGREGACAQITARAYF